MHWVFGKGFWQQPTHPITAILAPQPKPVPCVFFSRQISRGVGRLAPCEKMNRFHAKMYESCLGAEGKTFFLNGTWPKFELSWYLEEVEKYFWNGCTFKEVSFNVNFEMWERWTRFWRISFQIGCNHYIANNQTMTHPDLHLYMGWPQLEFYFHAVGRWDRYHATRNPTKQKGLIGNEFHHHEFVKALRPVVSLRTKP